MLACAISKTRARYFLENSCNSKSGNALRGQIMNHLFIYDRIFQTIVYNPHAAPCGGASSRAAGSLSHNLVEFPAMRCSHSRGGGFFIQKPPQSRFLDRNSLRFVALHSTEAHVCW